MAQSLSAHLAALREDRVTGSEAETGDSLGTDVYKGGFLSPLFKIGHSALSINDPLYVMSSPTLLPECSTWCRFTISELEHQFLEPSSLLHHHRLTTLSSSR